MASLGRSDPLLCKVCFSLVIALTRPAHAATLEASMTKRALVTGVTGRDGAYLAEFSGATEVVLWGSGQPRREFRYVDDLADACLCLMQRYEDESPINVGWGRDLTIAELAATVARIVGFFGLLRYDTLKPDGSPRKLLDTTRLSALGWAQRTQLAAGIRATNEWFLNNRSQLRT